MADYVDATHLHVTARYAGASVEPVAAETWQIGFRLAVQNDVPINKNAGRVKLPNFTVSDAYVARTITGWNVEQGFAGSSSGPANVTDADQDTIVTNLAGFLGTIRGDLSDQYDLETIRVYPIAKNGRSLTAPSVYSPTGAAQDGSHASAMPPDVALAVTLDTSTRGVKGRGRFYLGGLAPTMMDTSGQAANAKLTIILDAAKTMFDNWRAMSGGIGDISCTPIIWHRKGDKAAIEDGTFGSPIRSIRMDRRFDTQRRRDRQVWSDWTDRALS